MQGATLEDEQIGVVCDGVMAAHKEFVAVKPACVVKIKSSNLLFGVVTGHAQHGKANGKQNQFLFHILLIVIFKGSYFKCGGYM